MTYVSAPGDLALHGVRVLGFPTALRVAARYGLDAGMAEAALLDFQARGWVRQLSFGGSSGWSLTDAWPHRKRKTARRRTRARPAPEMPSLRARHVSAPQPADRRCLHEMADQAYPRRTLGFQRPHAGGRGLVTLDAEAPVPVVEIALLRSPPLFAELSAPAIEGLAATLTPVEVPAGMVLIRQGDPGDALLCDRRR